MTRTVLAPPKSVTPLSLNDDLLSACVSCGLCLPHCPTYRATEEESASPRGRIMLMRAVEQGDIPIDQSFASYMERCVQCRGCDAACPSGVQFGHMMEDTRAALHASSAPATVGPWWRKGIESIAYRVVLANHRVLLALSWLLFVGQRLRLVPTRFGLPKLTVSGLRTRLEAPIGSENGSCDAWLFTGCVMDAWQRPTHAAALRVLCATGARVALPMRGGDCCGALHEHAGRRDEAKALAVKVMGSMPGAAPIVVDSAGCGAALEHYGRLLGTPQAAAFSLRVIDFSEYIASVGVPATRPMGQTVVIQDPCHLRHVQKAHLGVRTVLVDAYNLVETDDDGLCCGAGGAYSTLQPELATKIRERKAVALRAAGASEGGVVVCSANPGCAMHLAAAGFTVKHPAELLAEALDSKAWPS